VNTLDEYGNTALFYAVQNGHSEVVHLLLANPLVDPTESGIGYTPFGVAVERGYELMVQCFIKRGFEPETSCDYLGRTYLHTAMVTENVDMVQLLIESGNVLLNSKDRSNGATALHLAARGGFSKGLRLLLRCQSVDLNLRDMEGMTAFMLAAHGGHVETVKIFLE
ncbi:ankyrin, partial [Amniculicola lignicola CBS 123094]